MSDEDLPPALLVPELELASASWCPSTPLSVASLRLCHGVDYVALAEQQDASADFPPTDSSLVLERLPVPGSSRSLWCDLSQDGQPRPVVPPSAVGLIFDTVHNLSHAGVASFCLARHEGRRSSARQGG